MKEDAVYYQLLRDNLLFFVLRVFKHLNPTREYQHNWHVEAIVHHLELVMTGKIRRLIINLPPRYLKSQIVSVAFTAFLLGHGPSKRIYGISYGADLSLKHAADVRSVMESAWYKRVFPRTRIIRAIESSIHTNKRGYRIGTSVNASLTGFGGDCFILDDIQKPQDAMSEAYRTQLNNWITNTLLPRQEDKSKASIVLVMQRVHLLDATGFLLENSDQWTVLSLPAIADEDTRVPYRAREGEVLYYTRRAGFALHKSYESIETLTQLRAEMGEVAFAAQYLQRPVPDSGAMISRSTIQLVDSAPARTPRMKVIQSWDTAGKTGPNNDYSVCTTILQDGDHRYIIHIERGKYSYSELKEKALELAARFKPTVILVEDASSGIQLAQDLTKLGRYVIKEIKSDGTSKEARVYLQQAKFDAGFVFFVKGIRNLPEAVQELLSFPQVKHDDFVDSLMQALAYGDKKEYNYDTSMRWVSDRK
jgi:predicted phage terminase large subunit-like protein